MAVFRIWRKRANILGRSGRLVKWMVVIAKRLDREQCKAVLAHTLPSTSLFSFHHHLDTRSLAVFFMDRDNQPNNNSNHGFFHHLLDPHLGEAIGNLVRGLLPQHQPQPQPTDQSPLGSSDAQDISGLRPPDSTIHISHSGTTTVGAPSGSGTSAGVGSIVSAIHLVVFERQLITIGLSSSSHSAFAVPFQYLPTYLPRHYQHVFFPVLRSNPFHCPRGCDYSRR